MTDNFNPNDPLANLRALANRWTMLARDYARDARSNTDEVKSNYTRGLAEGYYKAAIELADAIKSLPKVTTASLVAPRPTTPAAVPAPAAAPPPPEPPPAPTYLPLSVGEVINILEYSGVSPRDVTPTKNNTYIAVFSRWENIMPHERIEKIKAGDLRIVIVSSGKTKDTTDPYVEVAFQG
jgi:hypothetical protein